MAGLLYTTVCSPRTMTFPGAETMNVVAMDGELLLAVNLNGCL
jgi:hypothetical protein